MNWEREVLDILEGVDAKELAAVLVSRFEEVASPNENGYRNIGATLQRLVELISAGTEDMNTALWMAFWLGAAWQKVCYDAGERD